MWKLPTPDTDNVDTDLEIALTYANGTPIYPITPSQKDDIRAIYSLYDRLYGRACTELKAVHLGNPLLNAVRDAYGQVQEGGRLSALRDRLKSLTTICPYCGFGEIRDLDHHLPKADFKALAIYPKNLVPCCHPCNNKKRSVAGEVAAEQFFHTYLDNLPLEVFFKADISLIPEGLVVDFRIEQITGIQDDTYERMNYQMRKLDLNKRYKAQANIYLASIKSSIELVYGITGDAQLLRQFLVTSARSQAIVFGLNDWRPALLRGLAECEDFCNGGFRSALGQLNPGA